MKELLNELKEYIEEVEEQIEGEWGACRRKEELIADKDMPDVYWKVVKLIEKTK